MGLGDRQTLHCPPTRTTPVTSREGPERPSEPCVGSRRPIARAGTTPGRTVWKSGPNRFAHGASSLPPDLANLLQMLPPWEGTGPPPRAPGHPPVDVVHRAVGRDLVTGHIEYRGPRCRPVQSCCRPGRSSGAARRNRCPRRLRHAGVRPWGVHGGSSRWPGHAARPRSPVQRRNQRSLSLRRPDGSQPLPDHPGTTGVAPNPPGRRDRPPTTSGARFSMVRRCPSAIVASWCSGPGGAGKSTTAGALADVVRPCSATTSW